MQSKSLSISKLKSNTGQIDGLPANPRVIRDEKFQKLVKSIQDDPEMLELRELIVVPSGKIFVVIAGNMRLRAMESLGYKEAPCKVLDADTPVEKLKAYAIKDNVGFGEHDWEQLANEWDAGELADWGLDVPGFDVPETPSEDPRDLSGELKETFEVIISCKDETHQQQVYNKMIADGYDVRVLTL